MPEAAPVKRILPHIGGRHSRRRSHQPAAFPPGSRIPSRCQTGISSRLAVSEWRTRESRRLAVDAGDLGVGSSLSLATGKVVEVQRIALHVVARREVIEGEHRAVDLSEAPRGGNSLQPSLEEDVPTLLLEG